MSFPVARLDEVCEINPRMPKTLPDDTEVSFLPMAAVSEAGLVDYEESREAREVKKGYTYFERGDILVAKITPCFENGKAARTISLNNPIGFGSTEFHVLRAGREIDSSYLFHLIWNSKFRKIGAENMTGSAGQKRVPADFLKRLEIPLPGLDEQRRIAAILDKADTLRRKRKCAIKLLDSLTQSIFQEMFGGLITATKKEKLTQPLGSLAEIVSGITKGRKLNGETTREVPYLAVANVQDKFLDLSVVKTIEATESEIRRYLLQRDDLLLTEGGDPDKLGRGTLWANELSESIHQNHIFRVRVSSSGILPLYLVWLIGSPYGKAYFLRSAKQTTGIASINKAQLSEFPVIVPPLAIQKDFEKKIQLVKRAIRMRNSSSASIEDLFSSLQHRAFSGEL